MTLVDFLEGRNQNHKYLYASELQPEKEGRPFVRAAGIELKDFPTTTFKTLSASRILERAGKLITFEIGLRFLTDWLEGDTYFKTKRPTHNLDRTRTQFRLVESIEAQLPAMKALVAHA